MKEPNLQINAILSLLVHITFILITFITIKQANHLVKPSMHIVSLVGPRAARTAITGKEAILSPETQPSEVSMIDRQSENTKQYIENRIAAIEATKKVKRIIGLRNLISIRSSAAKELQVETSRTPENRGEGGIIDSYEKKIGREIWQHYTVIPELKGKNLETIISVTVIHDGTIKINKIEKDSGNILFDRSVRRAIEKASPVSPPPYEMEIGLRFTP